MTNLSAQKRLAADVLDVGESRVWFDPEAQSEIAEAITRDDVRDLVDEGIIRDKEAKTNSRGRARARQEKRDYGHRQGAGSRKGKAGARSDPKDDWTSRIRAQRRRLRELRDEGTLTPTQYRELYRKAGGGEFDSVDRLETYAADTYEIQMEDD